MKLILVPTPIGNLADITMRALEVLRAADLIFCEDTRETRKLLQQFDIRVPLISYHLNNEHQQLNRVVEQIREHSQCVLVSDAGTPGISDPGYLLVRRCIEEGIDVECLPGPSAFIPALVISGLPCDRFVFEGFLPHKKGRETRIKAIASEKRTSVLYESPHRIVKTLEQMVRIIGPERKACVSRELTKHFEETRRGTLAELLEHFRVTPPRGEFVLVVSGAEDKSRSETEEED